MKIEIEGHQSNSCGSDLGGRQNLTHHFLYIIFYFLLHLTKQGNLFQLRFNAEQP